MIDVYGDEIQDSVIDANYCIGSTKYGYAITALVPLIERLNIQRDIQDTRFYARLRSDLIKGCVVPAVTIAFIVEKKVQGPLGTFINKNIASAFILDGIQRLNAISQAFQELELQTDKNKFKNRTLHLNILVAPSMDKLLYRMITLNNGQKPMSPKHQIDILAETVFDFENLELKNQTHKAKQKSADRLAAHRSDVIKAYIAFLSNTTAIDNKLVIEQKMDELLAERILQQDISEEKYEFSDILKFIASCNSNPATNKWFVNGNNLIGFCVAAKKSFSKISKMSTQEISSAIDRFEDAIFPSFDKKKIKVGEYRRKMVHMYFDKYADKYANLSDSDLIIALSEQ